MIPQNITKESSYYSWVETHKELVQYLAKKRNDQPELITILKNAGVNVQDDKSSYDTTIPLEEIDPFTFFCYIYIYGEKKRLKVLQSIADQLGITRPKDERGLPSANAQKTWLFPYKYDRTNEIDTLWKLFDQTVSKNLTQELFEKALAINGIGKTKITEALFYVDPENFFPINGPSKPYLKEVLHINPEFKTLAEYQTVLNQIKTKSSKSFAELSYNSWEYSESKKNINYWLFQGNPDVYNITNALKGGHLKSWKVSAHKDKIKIGDKVIIWQTGKQSGCYALAEITGDVGKFEEEQFEKQHYVNEPDSSYDSRVKLKISHYTADSPLLWSELKEITDLQGLNAGNRGTNFKVSKNEFNFFNHLISEQNKLIQVLKKFSNEDLMSYFEVLDEMVEKLNLSTYDKRFVTGISNDNLNLTIGQRYCWNLYSGNDKPALGLITDTEINQESKLYSGKPKAWYTRFQNLKDIELYKNAAFNAIRSELSRTSKSSYSKYNNLAFELALFNIDYRKRLLGNIQSNTLDSENTKPIMNFPLNQLLYGPPGTGKTYNTVSKSAEIITGQRIEKYESARKIFQENLGNRIEFITFHQNYSYEDFIQGLRPDIENKELSFQRNDGLFAQIATNALFEYYKKLQKQKLESDNKPVKEPELSEVYSAYFKSLKKGQDFKTKSGSSIQIVGFSKSRNVEYAHFENGRPYLVSQDRLFKLYEIFPDINQIQKIHDDIRAAIGGCNTTVYYVALREFIEFRKDYITDYDLELSEEDIYDELKYDDISYDRKKELLAKTSLEQIRSINANDVPSYVLIIDEINRANISRVFGELITLLEPDKRSHGKLPLTCTLPSGERFIVPSNLYLIGTMNTADKSIALLDIALRRRFEFVPMYPDFTIEGVQRPEILEKINEKIKDLKTRDFTIGHSYFMGELFSLKNTIDKKIIPLLLEYFMNDEKEVITVLDYAGLEIGNWPLELIKEKTND
ncbi:EVE domain-containing protein [Leeuwenhoekiella sp. NPDC079379]|uniref:EVE domain-containing protein n=1 Tax=Leeuwenhoekiella sp. NPDC079379 TaxID=3364122 RepID=UPI0037C84A58